jgi:hypothetical protein
MMLLSLANLRRHNRGQPGRRWAEPASRFSVWLPQGNAEQK